jgi:hypothetical protein
MRLVTATSGRTKAPRHLITKLSRCTAFTTAQCHTIRNRIFLPMIATKRVR